MTERVEKVSSKNSKYSINKITVTLCFLSYCIQNTFGYRQRDSHASRLTLDGNYKQECSFLHELSRGDKDIK